MTNRRTAFAGSAFLVAACLATTAVRGQQPAGPERWEKQIQAMEQQDEEEAPPADPIVFVGSSSIRMWKVDDSFPDLPVINRGFGGSVYADAAHYVDRIVIPYRPRTLVLYSGDNDLARGDAPAKVVADLQETVQRVHARLPGTRIVVIGVKPSIARWKLIEPIRETNRRIEQLAAADSRWTFVDVEAPMLGPDGMPRQELFLKDGLHLTPAGYEIWTSLVRPHLEPVTNVVFTEASRPCYCRRCRRARR